MHYQSSIKIIIKYKYNPLREAVCKSRSFLPTKFTHRYL